MIKQNVSGVAKHYLVSTLRDKGYHDFIMSVSHICRDIYINQLLLHVYALVN